MLQIVVPGTEIWDEKTERFMPACKDQVLTLEHSLVSISKWEQKYHKPFLSNEKKTHEEIREYIKCMVLTQNVPDSVYDRFTSSNYMDINAYIEDPATATVINERQYPGRTKNNVTSELIYCWMVMLNIPFKCEKWHLNRLLTLIRVCNIENSPKKKMSKSQVLRDNASLNAARKARLHSRG